MNDTNEDRLDLGGLRSWMTDVLPAILSHKFYWPDVYNRFNRLIEEVERLEYAIEAMQNTANKDKVSHREQIDSLTKERDTLSVQLAGVEVRLEVFEEKKEKLEAENSDLKQKRENERMAMMKISLENKTLKQKLAEAEETAKNYRIRLSNHLRKEPKT